MPKEISQVDQMIIMDALEDAAKLWEERAASHAAKGKKHVAEARAEMAKDARRLKEEISHYVQVVLK